MDEVQLIDAVIRRDCNADRGADGRAFVVNCIWLRYDLDDFVRKLAQFAAIIKVG